MYPPRSGYHNVLDTTSAKSASDVNANAWLAANTTFFTTLPHEAALPPITVGEVAPPRLAWWLLMDDFVQGTRGAAAREDQGTAGLNTLPPGQSSRSEERRHSLKQLHEGFSCRPTAA